MASRPWLAAIGMVGLVSVCFISVLFPRPWTNPGRFLMKSPEAILSRPSPVACPPSQEVSRGIGCEPHNFITPRANMTDEEFYLNLYRASECLIERIVMPSMVAVSRDRTLRGRHSVLGDNSGSLSSSGGPAADGWKALAERSLSVLQEHLYKTVTSCKFSRARGMYLNSSR